MSEPAPQPSPQRPGPDHGTEWLKGQGNAADVVLSSRVRLARNLAGLPFVNKAPRDKRQEVLDLCRAQIAVAGLGPRVAWYDLHHTPALERTVLVERHLISQQHARGKQSSGSGGTDEPRAVAVTVPDERLSIMVNEEDHVRLQAIRCGLDLSRTLADAAAIDDRLEAGLDFAFSPRFGYLTACPTNVGTGIRLSVMLHLPGLRLMGDIEKIKRAATDMSLAVRGFYGEGSEAAGDLYQISNQTTLGKTEEMLLQELEQQIIPQVIEAERKARRDLTTKRRMDLLDQVFRALGALTSARLMTTEESMQLLSLVRLGVVTGVIDRPEQGMINQLMLLTQPAHLQRVVGKELDQDHRRAARAELLRARLARAM
jgi:protein arginine kinase